jgi:hypothetical protein
MARCYLNGAVIPVDGGRVALRGVLVLRFHGRADRRADRRPVRGRERGRPLQKQTLNLNLRRRIVQDVPVGMALEGLTAGDLAYHNESG